MNFYLSQVWHLRTSVLAMMLAILVWFRSRGSLWCLLSMTSRFRFPELGRWQVGSFLFPFKIWRPRPTHGYGNSRAWNFSAWKMAMATQSWWRLCEKSEKAKSEWLGSHQCWEAFSKLRVTGKSSIMGALGKEGRRQYWGLPIPLLRGSQRHSHFNHFVSSEMQNHPCQRDWF